MSQYETAHVRRRQVLTGFVNGGILAASGSLGLLLPGCRKLDWAGPQARFETLSAREVGQRIRDGEFAAKAYVDRLLALYRDHEELNTVIWIDADKLRQEARETDHDRNARQTLGPLAGVPLIIKDNINVADVPTTAGTPGLRGYTPSRTAPAASALFKAGALLFAKANMHELAAGGTSANAAFGVVRNPHDPTRIPGGSSGGTAAAIAAGFVPAGLGTDTAGSVRIPAALCGCVGFRPSIPAGGELWPRAGIVPLSHDLDTVGPLARDVADAALLHNIVTGQSATPVGPRRLRLGVPREHFWDDLDATVRAVSERALARLEAMGVSLVEIDIRELTQSAGELFRTLTAATYIEHLSEFVETAVPLTSWTDVQSQIASSDVKALFKIFENVRISPKTLEAARQDWRPQLVADYRKELRSAQVDAIVYPTVPIPAPPIARVQEAQQAPRSIEGGAESLALRLIRNTLIMPVLRAPAISIPSGFTPDGLPVGLEVAGWPGEDEALLAAGLTIEQVLAQA